MRHGAAGHGAFAGGRRLRPRSRLRAILCKPGPDEVTDTCLMMLSREADVEQAATLAEAMKRCLEGRADILFVNMFAVSSREMTALSAFHSLARPVWIVALASEEMKPWLLGTGIADEVLTAAPAVRRASAHP